MQKRLLKILNSALSLIIILNSCISVFAYELNENGNSTESVSYKSSNNEDFTPKTDVFAELKSEYKVTIPKTVVLSGNTKSANYKIHVEGDIAGYEAIKVIPEEEFNLFSVNKDLCTAKINQDKTIWYVSDFDTDANGFINAPSITAGKWTGVFFFNLEFVNMLEERVLGDIIIPDYLDGDYRLLLSKLSVPGIYNENAKLMTPYDTLINQGFDIESNNGGSATFINTNYPKTTFVVLPDNIKTIGNNAFENTNIQYVYIPDSVESIGDNAFFGSKLVSANIPSNTNVASSAFDNTPATSNKESIYYGKSISRTVNVNLEDKDEDIIELERGYRYQITALYNFRDNVTKQSTIKVSDESIIKFVPEYYIDALEDGEATITGKYTTKNGNIKDASIKVRVKHTHIKGKKVEENYVDSTCTSKGSYDEIIYCALCNKELQNKKIEIEIKPHVSGPVTIENVVEPTCLTGGSYDEVVYCKNCNYKLRSTNKTTSRLGHNYVDEYCTRCGHKKEAEAGIYDSAGNLIYTWEALLDK